MEDSTEVRITLRLPRILRDRLQKSAETHSRSMNGEIVFRLDEFDRLVEENHETARRLEEAVQVNSYLKDVQLVLEEHGIDRRPAHLATTPMKASGLPMDRSLYVVLDAAGHPISWQETMTHLGEIGRAANLQIDRIEARVIDAKPAKNDEREEAWWNLIRHYRKLRKRTPPAK